MYGWWFISTLLSLNVICHANPANNMVIGYNCTGFSTASRIFGVVESMEAIAINNRPWWNIFSLFNSKPSTILDTVRTYPPTPNESCTITCVRVQDLTGTATLVQKIAGGIGEHFISIRSVSMPNKGLLFNITLDGFCNTLVSIDNGQLVLSPKWDEEVNGPEQTAMPIGWIRPSVPSTAPPLPPVNFK